jgi:hypothetical protein
LRRFHLNRLDDETGISGKGLVTNGIEFNDGTVVMAWNTETTSLGVYRNMDDLIKIHGHGGKTVVVYAEEENFEVFPEFLHDSDALFYLSFMEDNLG